MEYLIKLKHYLEILFYPFFNYIGWEWQWANFGIKFFIFLIWIFLLFCICFLMNRIDKRKNEEEISDENNKTSSCINIGLWGCLFTTFFYVVLNIIYSYIYYHFDNTRFNLFSLFSIGLFIIFIFYCIYMNKYYNPKTETEYREKIQDEVTENEIEESIIIYNEEENKGTRNFFIVFLTFLCLFLVLQGILIILLLKNKKNPIIDFLTSIFASNITIEKTSSGVNYIRKNGCRIVEIPAIGP